tara:strand:+ start:98 stop:1480 length:1383 start_codon:yes stop_codon:yes gene_type:complete
MSNLKDIQEIVMLYNQGDFSNGIKRCENIFDSNKTNPIFLHIFGLFHHALSNQKKAISLYKKSLEIKPDYIDALVSLGRLHLESDFEESFFNFSKALQLNKQNTDILNCLGDLHFKYEKYEQAKEYFHKAFTHNQSDNISMSNLGICLYRLGYTQSAITHLQKSLEIEPNYISALNNLAVIYMDLENYQEGLSLLQKVISLDKNNFLANKNSGLLYTKLEDFEKAKIFIENALKYNKDDDELNFIYDSVNNKTPKNAPLGYVESLFNNYAKNFERSLTKELDYKFPKKMCEFVIDCSDIPNIFDNAIDLGCGTGLSGEVFRDYVDFFTGVDLSKNMLDIAKKKKIYDELLTGDICNILEKSTKKYNLFIIADVFIYIGELQDVFSKIKNRSEEGAIVIFSTEHLEEGDYLLVKQRYRHSKNYIEKILKQNNFNFIDFKTENLRKDKDSYITGGIYLANYN